MSDAQNRFEAFFAKGESVAVHVGGDPQAGFRARPGVQAILQAEDSGLIPTPGYRAVFVAEGADRVQAFQRMLEGESRRNIAKGVALAAAAGVVLLTPTGAMVAAATLGKLAIAGWAGLALAARGVDVATKGLDPASRDKVAANLAESYVPAGIKSFFANTPKIQVTIGGDPSAAPESRPGFQAVAYGMRRGVLGEGMSVGYLVEGEDRAARMAKTLEGRGIVWAERGGKLLAGALVTAFTPVGAGVLLAGAGAYKLYQAREQTREAQAFAALPDAQKQAKADARIKPLAPKI